MRIRPRLLAGLVVVTLLAVGCGDDNSGGESAAEGLPEVAASEFVDMTGESEIVIDAKDNVFETQFVTVSPGTKVTFENAGRNPHNVIPVDKSQFESIPADQFRPDDSATRTFEDPGVYPYYCSLHGTPSAGMDGRIRVAES